MSNLPLIRDFVSLARCCNHIAMRQHRMYPTSSAPAEWRTQRDGYMQAARLAKRDACR